VIDAVQFINLGIGGMFLVLLFIGFLRGQLYTRKSVEVMLVEKENRLKDKDVYIAKLEEINEKLDNRNDILAGKFDQILEVARAQGMIAALPDRIGERVVK
jgi:hypothetical protein